MATSVSQCTYRCVVLPDKREVEATRAADGLNAPTGAWCSLTLPSRWACPKGGEVSMHLQVRGAP